MAKGHLPPETSIDDVRVRIRKTYTNPNVGKIHQVILKDGPRTFKIATLLEIVDGKTGEFHHFSLKIDTINRLKAGWFAKPERSTRLEGGDPDEIEHLFRFLKAHGEGIFSNKTGELHVIAREDYMRLEKLLEALPNLAAADKIELVKTILSQLEASHSCIEEFVKAFQSSNSDTLRNIAVASRIVEYKKAYAALKSLVENPNTTEPNIQKHLEQNPWMFGSEYSELLDRRTCTRDDTVDYMLRRTVDNFLEIIEIKTPFPESLFIYDKSHGSYYPSAKLSPVIGQVMRYIEEVERSRDSILSKDGYDTLKIRARIIIGRDGDGRQQVALRNLNAHLYRIEVITYDQLLRIATKVLVIFESEISEESEVVDNYEIQF